MEQYTIFGTTEEISDVEESKFIVNNRKLTIKQKFRLKYGYNEEVQCKNCLHCTRINVNDKHYYKCEIIGITSSPATDIRLKDFGCAKWEKM